jgi:hypothetical protein
LPKGGAGVTHRELHTQRNQESACASKRQGALPLRSWQKGHTRGDHVGAFRKIAERFRSRTAWLFCLCAIAAWCTTSIAQQSGMGREVDFHISQGPLEVALLQFSRQANVPITLAPNATEKLHTDGLAGRVTITAALNTLLQHSGLSYAVIGETVTITRPTNGQVERSVPTLHAGDSSRNSSEQR